MKKLAKELLKNNDSYIDALQKAIDGWKEAKSISEKRDYMLAIGEIGNEIHRQNKSLDIANMDVED